MLNASTIRTAVGVTGNVISFGLFLSPCPTFWRIFKRKSVEEFSAIPYLATILNCALWVFYGIVQPDSTLVATINGIGLAIEFFYIAIFLIYATSKGRKKVMIWLLAEAAFFVGIAMVIKFAVGDVKIRSIILGVVCDIFNILMYASPLVVMKQVITTKSVKYMPFWLSLANFVNAGVWAAYALIGKIDPYVLTSNGVGVILGLIQLVLYAWYYRTTNWEDDVLPQQQQKPQIQLSTANAESAV